MKKRLGTFVLIAALLSAFIVPAAAADSRAATYKPILSFDGTTASCYFSVAAIGKPITATLELWHGNTRIATWSDSATSYLVISEEQSVTAGENYTLKVSGTIDGVPFTGTPITGTCPE